MSSMKGFDLKCSETLRDSPPPAPNQVPFHSSNTDVFSPAGASSNPPTHQPPTGPVMITSPFGQFISQQQAAAVSLFVKQFDSSRGSADAGSPGRVPSTGHEIGTASSSTGRSIVTGSANSSPSNLSFGAPNAGFTSKPPSSHVSSQQPVHLFPQHSSHLFPGFTLPSAGGSSIWPLIQQATGSLPHHLPSSPPKSATLQISQSSPSKGQQSSPSSATLPLTLSPSKGSSGTSSGSSHGRPVTLHVSTSRGPAVLQLQQSTTSANAKQPVKVLPAATGGSATSLNPSPRHAMSVGVSSSSRAILPPVPPHSSSLGGAVPTRVPILRPSPVHPMAAATAAILSQLASNASTFGLVEQHNAHLQQQQLQAAAAFLRSPLVNTDTCIGGTGPPHIIGANQQNPSQGQIGRTVIVSVPGSQLLAGPTPQTAIAGSASPLISTIQGHVTPSKNVHGSIPPTAAAAVSTTRTVTPTPSPTRPSILRKRASEISNGTSSSPSPSKRLTGEYSARRGYEKRGGTPDPEARSIGMVTSTNIENPDAGNSNHSSSASTISASSAPDSGNGHSVSSNHASAETDSPSARKRPRKQQLSELASLRGCDSDDEMTTPRLGYLEPVEEESAVGPSGVGGVDYQYLSRSYPSTGRSPFYLSTVPLERALSIEGICSSERFTESMEGSFKYDYGNAGSDELLAAQRSRTNDRPMTSFDQLQQHIEQQRKHVPEYRPRPSILSNYELSYDSKRYHFATHDDVKARDEKRLSIVDLSNQKDILQRICGWKMYLMAVQFDNLDREEKTNLDDLNEIHSFLNSRIFHSDGTEDQDEDRTEEDKEVELLKEMVLSNVQRVHVIREYLEDGKRQLLSLLNHKSNAEKLINKYSTKRSARRKQRGNGPALE